VEDKAFALKDKEATVEAEGALPPLALDGGHEASEAAAMALAAAFPWLGWVFSFV
jgi:hypothetical protein